MRAVGQAYQKEIKHFGPWRIQVSESSSDCNLIPCSNKKIKILILILVLHVTW